MERASVRRLRTGVVPLWQVESLSVGYEKAARVVADSLRGLRAGELVQALYVRGEWGTGKTHLLSYVRAKALAAGMVASFVSLNGRSLPLNLPQRLYAAIAEAATSSAGYGLRNLLVAALQDAAAQTDIARFLTSGGGSHMVPEMHILLRAVRDGDAAALLDPTNWTRLLGEDIANVTTTNKRDVAFERLQFVAGLFKAIGSGGLVLIFDEAETIDQLWNIRSRSVAYQVIWRLTSMRNVWCLFGVTDRFRSTVAGDFANERWFSASERLHPAATSFLRAWGKREARMLDAPMIDGVNATKLAESVASLYENAYGLPKQPSEIASAAVAQWRMNPGRNPRRLIRLVVHKCDLARPIDDGGQPAF